MCIRDSQYIDSYGKYHQIGKYHSHGFKAGYYGVRKVFEIVAFRRLPAAFSLLLLFLMVSVKETVDQGSDIMGYGDHCGRFLTADKISYSKNYERRAGHQRITQYIPPLRCV